MEIEHRVGGRLVWCVIINYIWWHEPASEFTFDYIFRSHFQLLVQLTSGVNTLRGAWGAAWRWIVWERARADCWWIWYDVINSFLWLGKPININHISATNIQLRPTHYIVWNSKFQLKQRRPRCRKLHRRNVRTVSDGTSAPRNTKVNVTRALVGMPKNLP